MITNNIRKSIVRMTYLSNSSHIASCLSIVDILYVLYFKILKMNSELLFDATRDRFILSKGHSSAALYATLVEKGILESSILDKYYVDGGLLPGHLDRESAPGIEVSTGSLGQGLSIGIGIAYTSKTDCIPFKVFVLIGDGECNEGMIWEAAMLAGSLQLDNITVIIDFNKMQGFGRTNEIINQDNMAAQWKAFGWEVIEVDGHNLLQLECALSQTTIKPKVVIAHTIKGKGVSFMEKKLEWHYKSPTYEEMIMAFKELDDCL
jgi:transketolase